MKDNVRGTDANGDEFEMEEGDYLKMLEEEERERDEKEEIKGVDASEESLNQS